MDDRSRYAYQYYLNKGYTPQAAAGITGNLMVESGRFSDDVLSGQRRGDKGTAFGAAQWRGERLTGLNKYAEQNGLDPRSMDAQLGYVDHEMRTGSDAGAGIAYQKLQQAQTPAEAAQAFMNHYERPNADPSINAIATRQTYANNLFGSAPDAGLTAPPVASGGGIASLPTATAAAGAGALPTVSEAAATDPMSGVFGLLMQARMAQATPQAAAPAPTIRRAPDTRSEEEKLASVSQTPNVYIDRIRRRTSNG